MFEVTAVAAKRRIVSSLAAPWSVVKESRRLLDCLLRWDPVHCKQRASLGGAQGGKTAGLLKQIPYRERFIRVVPIKGMPYEGEF